MINTNTQAKNATSPLVTKAEKIVSALYMVVSYIDQSDPIASSLKHAGLSFLESLYESKADVYRTGITGSFTQTYQALTGLIRIAKVSEIMSTMNADILLRNLAHLEKEKTEEENKTFVLPQDFFEKTVDLLGIEKQAESSVFEDKIFPTLTPTLSEKREYEKVSSRSHEQVKKEFTTPHTREISTGKKLDLALKLSRRNTLLKLTKDKGSVSIKECVSVINDCSEKTIQRELTALVDQNILKKTGEKRWSRYSLA
jgi:hypothetical protein